MAETIRAAVLAHASQAGPEENFSQVLLDWPGLLEEETFVLGRLRGAFPAMPADDLLAEWSYTL